MRSVNVRHSLIEKLVPPALRNGNTATIRRARLLAIMLSIAPALGIIDCILLSIINPQSAQFLGPIIIVNLLFWVLLINYWLRGNLNVTAHLSLFILNSLLIYFAVLWGVAGPTTIWVGASAVLSMYLLNNKHAVLHCSYAFMGYTLAAYSELNGLVPVINLNGPTSGVMALVSSFFAVLFTILVTTQVRFLYETTEQKLDREARTDILTGLSNRRHFFDIARSETAVAKKEGWPMAVLLIDMDHLKKINDTWGHDIGDAALRTLAASLNHAIPALTGFKARFAGDEFAVIVSHSHLYSNLLLANNIRIHVANNPITTKAGDSIALSVSIGAAEFWPSKGENIDDGLIRADRMLYKAKAEGRNNVIVDERLRAAAAS